MKKLLPDVSMKPFLTYLDGKPHIGEIAVRHAMEASNEGMFAACSLVNRESNTRWMKASAPEPNPLVKKCAIEKHVPLSGLHSRLERCVFLWILFVECFLWIQ